MYNIMLSYKAFTENGLYGGISHPVFTVIATLAAGILFFRLPHGYRYIIRKEHDLMKGR